MNRSGLPQYLGAVVAAALTLSLLAPVSAAETPLYARIKVGPKTIVYLQFQGDQMRMATSVAALKTAKAVSPKQSAPDVMIFPEVTLPVAAGALPQGLSKVKAMIALRRMPGGARSPGGLWYASGVVGPSRTDEKGALWTYWFQAGAPTATRPDSAQVWQVPELARLRLSVTAKVERRQLGVAVQVMAGTAAAYDIQKDGKSVEAQVMVRDADGNGIASERGPLAKFGFG